MKKPSPGNDGTANLLIGTSQPANREIGDPKDLRLGRRADPVWHREFWDRYMRDEYHLRKSIDYIHHNPVKAGLAARPEAWPWSSASPGNAPGALGNADLLIGKR